MPAFNAKMARKMAGAFLCAFIFIFTSYANVLNDIRTSSVGSLSAGISTAFVAVAVIYTFGGLSGAYFNPAIAVGAIFGGKISIVEGLIYILLQFLASLLAASLLMALSPEPDVASLLVVSVGEGVNSAQAIFFEFIMAFIIMYVILAVGLGVKTSVDQIDLESLEEREEEVAQNKLRLRFAPIAIGLTVGTLCFLGHTVSGGASNPGRSTAPAILSGSWTNVQNLWVYWVGDFAGAVAAALIYKCICPS